MSKMGTAYQLLRAVGQLDRTREKLVVAMQTAPANTLPGLRNALLTLGLCRDKISSMAELVEHPETSEERAKKR